MIQDQHLPDLGGAQVLVVEDEFYLAAELKERIEDAKGSVLGPCSHEAAVAREMDRAVPDCAMVDINLGFGPSFKTAETLHARGIPFVFLTGYDAPPVPTQLKHIEQFKKPVEMERVLSAVERLTGRS